MPNDDPGAHFVGGAMMLAECGTDLAWSVTIWQVGNGTYNYKHDFSMIFTTNANGNARHCILHRDRRNAGNQVYHLINWDLRIDLSHTRWTTLLKKMTWMSWGESTHAYYLSSAYVKSQTRAARALIWPLSAAALRLQSVPPGNRLCLIFIKRNGF